ncbi:hypothetical protein JTE90_023193, partial [Oedothorax gibbosus]
MSMEWMESWAFRLLKNLIGYATVAVPGYFLYRYYKDRKFSGPPDLRWWQKCITLFVHGQEEFRQLEVSKSKPTAYMKALIMLGCFTGLQIFFLTWGYLQEKIMTQEYKNSNGEVQRFTDSQFLVFVNRFLAFIFASTYVSISQQPRHIAPLFKYSYCSFSNIMSSWFQYEALKYVSFPTQVLSKASKIIPVMIMSKIISKKSYKYHEYATAVVISIGTGIFLLSGKKSSDIVTTTTVSGVVILISYIASDSFTSNWQEALYKQYRMSSVQMMCGVNFFSCITRFIKKLLTLIEHGAKQHLKHLTEYFTFLLEFAKMGEEECQFLLSIEAISTIVNFYLGQKGADYVEVLSDEEEDDEEEVVAAVDDKYKPASLEKMITLIALLAEKSRDEERLQLSVNDFNAVAGGK